MGTASWAIPVGVLAGLCGIMFIFIWWWFPRVYKRGVQADMDRVDEDIRLRNAAALQEEGNAEMAVGEDGQPIPPKKPTTFTYQPPAYTSY
nr:hypothetical protein CFP56_77043 [Quercus suber]